MKRIVAIASLLCSMSTGCHALMRLTRDKYDTFPAGSESSALSSLLPEAERLFKQAKGGSVDLRRASVESQDWIHLRNDVTGAITARKMEVWLGWEDTSHPGDCRLQLQTFFQENTGANAYGPLTLGKPVARGSKYIGGRIDCGELSRDVKTAAARN